MKKQVEKKLNEKPTETVGARQALINAGLELFGELGLNGASTRMLAKKAGVNISAINYYFDNKEHLYQAVLEHIVEYFSARTKPIRQEIWQRVEESNLDKAEALHLLQKQLSVLIDSMLINKEILGWLKIIVREQTCPSAGFDILYQGHMKDTLKTLAYLVGFYTDTEPSAPEVIIKCHTIIGQIIGFMVTREALLRNLKVSKLNNEHMNLIKCVILSNVESCLAGSLED